MGQVLSCEINRPEVLMLLNEAEDRIVPRENGKRAVGLAQSETFGHVERFFDRNLGYLTYARAGWQMR